MKNLTYAQIRQAYLDFFRKRDHAVIAGTGLVPEDDPTVLYVPAGMFPLVPYLLGEQHPEGTRLVNSQRCIRTVDIDTVGDAQHLTAFEMLGNWSLNDYFKEEAIEMTVSFYVEELGIPIDRIYASVFAGDDDAPIDDESIQAWKKVFAKYGIDAKVGQDERIYTYSKEENWWELPAGGPCGPDSEIFYDTGKEKCSDQCGPACDCGKYAEIGNNVFMQYQKEIGADGQVSYKPLGRHNVDFGGGLDRLAMISQGKDSVWETDINLPFFSKIQEMTRDSELTPDEQIRSQRIITDHLKASAWIIADGVIPSNKERGYILRRLIRRAIRHINRLGGSHQEIISEVVPIIIQQFAPFHPKLQENKASILDTMTQEAGKFDKAMTKGLQHFNKVMEKQPKEISGEEAFYLYETYGFPVEVVTELAQERGIQVDLDGFEKAQQAHKDLSRTASAGLFKGGLADDSVESRRLHTATHLLLAALRKHIGEHIYQKGSNITPERLRFDFPNDKKLTPEQLRTVEQQVNEWIKADLPISSEEVSKEEALQRVPFAAFDDKYGNVVKLYKIGEGGDTASVEICRGPHAKSTGELGHFKIVKQENVGAGVKRIKAILEPRK